jgi:hypothetical protein
MPLFGAPLNLNKAELQLAVVQNLAAAPLVPNEGQIYYDTALHAFGYYNASGWVYLYTSVSPNTWDANSIVKADTDNTPVALVVGEEQIVGRITGGTITGLSATQVRAFLGPLNYFTAPNGPITMGNQRITGVSDAIDAADVANKAYVDAAAQGLDVKESVRVATTEVINLVSPGATIDGIGLVQGDRVLVKNQQDQATPLGEQNGIYIWDSASTPMTRSADAGGGATPAGQVTAGLFTFVEEGTVNHDRGYVLITDNPIVLDTTPLEFTQFSGAGAMTGTADRITVTGNQIDIASTYVGQISITTTGTIATGTWHGATIDVLYGGTGATTAAGAKTNLGFMTRVAGLIGNNSDTTLAFTHNLNTEDIIVELYDAATKQTIYADVVRTSVNAISITFAYAPTTNQYRVVVIG